MSLDVFFFSGLDGKPVPFFDRYRHRRTGRIRRPVRKTCWILKFPDGGWPDLYLNDTAEISLLMLNRPALSPELWRRIFDIMAKTSGILGCTGAGCCVTDPSVISRIDFVDAVSPVIVVDDPANILVRVKKALRMAARYAEHAGRRANVAPP